MTTLKFDTGMFNISLTTPGLSANITSHSKFLAGAALIFATVRPACDMVICMEHESTTGKCSSDNNSKEMFM